MNFNINMCKPYDAVLECECGRSTKYTGPVILTCECGITHILYQVKVKTLMHGKRCLANNTTSLDEDMT